MNSEYLDEEAITIVNNEYDYSNGIPTIESISYLVKYLDNVYKNFLNLIEEDEKKNLQFKTELKNYLYKKSTGERFEIYIKEKNNNNLTCEDFVSFQNAVNDGNLKNIDGINITMDLDFKRGKGTDLVEYENSFTIIFKPYDIKFARKSNHSAPNMDKVEIDIKSILSKFPVVNTVFCTKE